MAPEVFFNVCYNVLHPPAALTEGHSFLPGILQGFSRRRVKSEDYPGIAEQEGHTVRGIVATGLTEANLYQLDYYEGREYERRRVKINLLKEHQCNQQLKGGCDVIEAFVYVYGDAEALEEGEWDFDEFRREKMLKYTRAGYAFEG